jgi:hypothetical protein
MLVVHSPPLDELANRERDIQLNLAENLATWKSEYLDIDVGTLLLAGAPRDTVAPVSAEATVAHCRCSLPRPGVDALDQSCRAPLLERSVCPVAVISQQQPRLANED